jgi:hypothetical protein
LLVTANVVPSSLNVFTDDGGNTLLQNIGFNKVARRHIPEDGILHSHRRENFKTYVALTGWSLSLRCNVFPVRYEWDFYIPEDDIPSHRHENLKSYITALLFTVQILLIVIRCKKTNCSSPFGELRGKQLYV